MVTSAQLRAARGLLNWTVRDLAEHAGVHRNTVTRAETDANEHGHAIAQVVKTLEAAGVIFVAENGEGPGVRLRKSAVTASELTKQIDAIGKELAEADNDAPASPAKGMQQLEDAHKAEKAVKLRNKRAKMGK